MDSTEILKEIYSLVDRLDELCPMWAKRKSDHNYASEMKNVTLNMEKAKSASKTAIGREEEAYRSEAYKNYLYKVFEIDCVYYSLDAQKSLLEKKLDAYRSLLSWEKSMTNKTT
jgi:hypothetical protein